VTRGVDGDRLLRAAVRFGRELRAAGLQSDPATVLDFARALAIVDIGDRQDVLEAGAAVFVRHRDERPTYERVFRRFWRRRPLDDGPRMEPPTAIVDDREPGAEEPTRRGTQRDPRAPAGTAAAPGAEGRAEDAPGADEVDATMISQAAWSHAAVDRHRQFDRMSTREIRDAERFIDLLAPALETRRTRRRELHRRGRVLAPRVMFRRNLRTGGDVVEWVWQRTVRRPRTLVVLCDISGSMERHARLLLRFSQALAASAVRTEAFVFGTRLTRVTRLLDDRDRDRALARVADATTDWSGGTRIGDCFREFNQRWARRVLRSSAVVVVVSDGWDRGDPALVARETARLRRSCHRLIWLNPLASAEGYRPLAGGMAAALPSIDDFVPAGTLASLERLAVLLGRARVRHEGAAGMKELPA
jgi:uncharacterized protein with von Willebrand factor type A (vWA) domain